MRAVKEAVSLSMNQLIHQNYSATHHSPFFKHKTQTTLLVSEFANPISHLDLGIFAPQPFSRASPQTHGTFGIRRRTRAHAVENFGTAAQRSAIDPSRPLGWWRWWAGWE